MANTSGATNKPYNTCKSRTELYTRFPIRGISLSACYGSHKSELHYRLLRLRQIVFFFFCRSRTLCVPNTGWQPSFGNILAMKFKCRLMSGRIWAAEIARSVLPKSYLFGLIWRVAGAGPETDGRHLHQKFCVRMRYLGAGWRGNIFPRLEMALLSLTFFFF